MLTETSLPHPVPLFVTKCTLQAPLSTGFPRQKLEWAAVSFSRGSSRPRDRTWVSCTGRRIVYHWGPWELCCVLVVQSSITLCDPVDYSLPGSSLHGIFQVRILEWVAIFFSRGSSPPRDRSQVSCIASGLFTVWATRESPVLYIKRT